LISNLPIPKKVLPTTWKNSKINIIRLTISRIFLLFPLIIKELLNLLVNTINEIIFKYSNILK